MGRERLFRFKYFTLNHAQSAMKVGTDAVSLGAWAPCSGKVLDVGCGCGIIGLMAAQRGAEQVTMLDIDAPSAAEATENAANSPWSDRICVQCGDFLHCQGKYDSILSNPPFFATGIVAPDSRRAAARHEGTLLPEAFMHKAAELLLPGGTVSIIVPSDRFSAWRFAAELAGLYPSIICSLLTKVGAEPRRIMATFVLFKTEPVLQELSLDSKQYKQLTEDFYL